MTNTHVNRLNRAECYRLADYLRAHYVTSGLDNAAFAAQANEALGMTKLNRDTIRNTLQDLGMQPNMVKKQRPPLEGFADVAVLLRLQTVEDALATLTARFDKLVNNLGGV